MTIQSIVLTPEQQTERDLIRACKSHIKADTAALRAFRVALSAPHDAKAPSIQSQQDHASKQARARLYLYTLLRGLPLERIGGRDVTLDCRGHEDGGGCGKQHWNARYFLQQAWKQTYEALPAGPSRVIIQKPRGADFLD